ncbi:hypothetical protein HG530_010848 [Fusarium avenaceum]|nr:hypothetical protein HG530_010848 [Fusarium avenaceum]
MTAVKELQFNAFDKLLKHLNETQISLHVVNESDKEGMTPLMQLVAYEPEQFVTKAIEHLFKFKPDVDNLVGALPSTSLVYRLARSLPASKLLQIDDYGETAFDVAFDKEGKCPRPAFEPLLKDLVDRVAQSDNIEELCWATYRLERHTIAQQLFQKKYTKKEISPNRQQEKQWGIIEWAIHARLPRVLQTYLRALGMERRTIGDDNIHNSIENGRKMIGEMKKEVLQPLTPAAKGKTKKEERGPPNGSDSQTLRDLEDILDYLYPGKGEIVTNSLEVPKPDPSMQETLREFSAAIIQSTFVKFRTIQDVLYEVDSVKHIQDNVRRLKRFDFDPKVSSEQASANAEADSEAKAQFTWIHLPSNNITWMEDAVKNILKGERCPEDEADKVASFLRRSWIEIPDRKSTSRFMRPRYVSNKTDHSTGDNKGGKDGFKDTGKRGSRQTGFRSQHNEHRGSTGSGEGNSEGEQGSLSGDNVDGPRHEEGDAQTNRSGNIETVRKPITNDEKSEKRGSYRLSAIYMPYLYFSTYHKSESQEQMETAALPSELRSKEKKVLDEISRRQRLFKAYENSVTHQPTTLDEFYYQFSSDKDSVGDRNSRNKDQVVTKYLLRGGIATDRYWPLLRVSQLWVWIVNEEWLITSTSCATNDIRDNLVTDILEHLRRQVENGSREFGPISASEMSRVIVDYCIGTYDRKRKSQDVSLDRCQSLRPDDTAIGDKHQGRKESSLFGLSYGGHDRSRQPETSPGVEDTSKMMKDLKDALKTVAEQLRHIKDIRDELNILMSIARFQRKVQSTMNKVQMSQNHRSQSYMTKSQPDEDLSSDYLLRDLKELDRFADQTQEAVCQPSTPSHDRIC